VVQLNKKLGPPCYEAWWWEPEEASVLLIWGCRGRVSRWWVVVDMVVHIQILLLIRNETESQCSECRMGVTVCDHIFGLSLGLWQRYSGCIEVFFVIWLWFQTPVACWFYPSGIFEKWLFHNIMEPVLDKSWLLQCLKSYWLLLIEQFYFHSISISYAHQDCIYMIKITVNSNIVVILWPWLLCYEANDIVK